MDKPQRLHYAKWSKLVTKGQILYKAKSEVPRVVQFTEDRMVVARCWRVGDPGTELNHSPLGPTAALFTYPEAPTQSRTVNRSNKALCGFLTLGSSAPYGPQGRKELDTTEHTCRHTHWHHQPPLLPQIIADFQFFLRFGHSIRRTQRN